MTTTTQAPSIFRRLFDLALPIVGLNLLGVLALAVDTAMCGRLPEAEEALTALGFASQVIFLLMVAMMGLTVGTVAFVSRAHGAGESARIDHVLQQSALLTYLVSIAVAVIGNLLAGTVIGWLGAEENVRTLAVSYLRPLLTFTVFYYLNMLLTAALRGVGNTRLPFLVAIVSNVLNILLNYGLIFGHFGLPAWGVVGAAWGTVISSAFALMMTVLLLNRGAVPGISAKLGLTSLDRPLAKELFAVGAPAALDMVMMNIAFLSIVGMLGRVAQVAVAAHGVGLRIQSLAFVPGLGISQATGAMVGNALGAGDVYEAKSILRSSVILSFSMMTIIGLAIVFGAVPIIEIFNIKEGTPLANYSLTWVKVLGWGMPIVGVHIAVVGLLRGAGATNTSLQINMVGTLLVQVPLSIFLGFGLGWGAFGIWVAFPISFVVKMLHGLWAYRQGAWARTGLRA